MVGRFMDKKTVIAEAERLGVDIEGLAWPKMQSVVMAAQREEQDVCNIVLDPDASISAEKYEEIKEEAKGHLMDERPGDPVWVHVPVDPMDDMRGKTLTICPEMAPTATQLFGYDEELGDELIVEEVVHDIGKAEFRAGRSEVNGTYRVMGKTGKKIVAQTALPKEGSGIHFRPDVDLVPTTTFQGRTGYLWTHHSLPNIKQLLIESGYYEDYRRRFQDEPFVWHSAGKILACDINLVHSIFREIERKERDRRLQAAQQRSFIEQSLMER